MGSISARAPPSMNFPLDPSLDRDNWAELARHRPDAFLHALVSALSAPNPVSAAGVSVEDAFRAHLASLTPNVKNNNMPAADVRKRVRRPTRSTAKEAAAAQNKFQMARILENRSASGQVNST